MKIILFVFLVISLVVASEASAFRCGGELITVGDSALSLELKCGPPDRKEYAVEKFKNRWESVEKWFYNCGDNDFIYMLTIVHSKVVAEDIAGRGVGKSKWQN